MKTTEMIAAAVGSDFYPIFFKKTKEFLDYFLKKISNLTNNLEPTVSLYTIISK